MKLHIIGPGVVGRATGEGFRRFGHEVVYTDAGDNHRIEADLHFICTPEAAVAEVTAQVSGQIVIRSTMPPGATEALAEELHRPWIWHNPAFMQEATAEQDFLRTSYAVVGCISGAKCLPLERLYKDMGVEVHWCSTLESELTKLCLNAYFATQMSFWNELSGYMKRLGMNSHKVARLVALDKRVSTHGAFMHGAPYNGRCLPKDLGHLLDAMGGYANLLRAVREVNEQIKGPIGVT